MGKLVKFCCYDICLYIVAEIRRMRGMNKDNQKVQGEKKCTDTGALLLVYIGDQCHMFGNSLET